MADDMQVCVNSEVMAVAAAVAWPCQPELQWQLVLGSGELKEGLPHCSSVSSVWFNFPSGRKALHIVCLTTWDLCKFWQVSLSVQRKKRG